MYAYLRLSRIFMTTHLVSLKPRSHHLDQAASWLRSCWRVYFRIQLGMEGHSHQITSTGIDADASKGETSPGYFNSKSVFHRPEVRKLLLFYFYFFLTWSWKIIPYLLFFTFSFSWPEVGKLFHIYFFTFSQTEVGKLFRSYVFTFSRPEVGKLFHISMAKCKTAVTPLLIHWSYCSLALSHQNME